MVEIIITALIFIGLITMEILWIKFVKEKKEADTPKVDLMVLQKDVENLHSKVNSLTLTIGLKKIKLEGEQK